MDMKRVMLGCFIGAISNISLAAKEPLKEVSEIVEIPNMAQKQIFDAAKIWMAQSFKSSNSVIQYEDQNTGTIVGKGNMKYPCKGAWNCLANEKNLVLFTVKIDTKDNKARVTFNDLLLKTATTINAGIVIQGYEVGIYVPKDKENIENGLKEVIQKFKSDVQKNPAYNDW
jgi:hypothetical protein